MTYFRTPISMSAPHTYISTGPFLPSESPLSMVFSTHFTKSIKMEGGKLLSWPVPPLEWIGHNWSVHCMSYSPTRRHIVTGFGGKAIRIWDVETGDAVGKPLEGHTGPVWSVAYSPDGRHIISGSDDKTIRIWNGETGSAVGKPLEGHTGPVWSVAYSPDGRYIISGSDDKTIRIRNAEAGSAVGKPLEGHTGSVVSCLLSQWAAHHLWIRDKTIRIWDAKTLQSASRGAHSLGVVRCLLS
jgi:WD40 repeat protein